jgi:hypothetical protein
VLTSGAETCMVCDMTALLNPKAVGTALARMEAGDTSPDVISVIVAGAEAYASGSIEWGFKTLKEGMMYSTSNAVLATEMSTDMLDETVYARVGLPWVTED